MKLDMRTLEEVFTTSVKKSPMKLDMGTFEEVFTISVKKSPIV